MATATDKYKDTFALLGAAFAFSALALGLVGFGYWLARRARKPEELAGFAGLALPVRAPPPRMPALQAQEGAAMVRPMQPARTSTHMYTIGASAAQILPQLGASDRLRDVRIAADQPVFVSSSAGDSGRGLLLAPGTVHSWGEIDAQQELWAVVANSNSTARVSVMVRYI